MYKLFSFPLLTLPKYSTFYLCIIFVKAFLDLTPSEVCLLLQGLFNALQWELAVCWFSCSC